jgi:hypothetical protein
MTSNDAILNAGPNPRSITRNYQKFELQPTCVSRILSLRKRMKKLFKLSSATAANCITDDHRHFGIMGNRSHVTDNRPFAGRGVLASIRGPLFDALHIAPCSTPRIASVCGLHGCCLGVILWPICSLPSSLAKCTVATTLGSGARSISFRRT